MNPIEILIGKFLADECSPAEKIQLEHWLEASPENRAHFEELQKIWLQAEMPKQHSVSKMDVEAALQKTKTRIEGERQKPVSQFSFGKVLRTAAAVIFGLAAAWWIFHPQTIQMQEFTAVATAKTDTLGDGSVLALNRNSKATVRFTEKKREISLQGEAFFEVAPDKNKPFVVEIQELQIEVIGTKFNVDNGSSPDKISVVVTEGKVKLSTNSQQIFLMAGEKADFHRLNGQFEKVKMEEHLNVKAWLDQKFVFDETPLKTVAEQLEKVYGVRIMLKNKALENCLVYTVFEKQSIERIIEILAETLSLSVEKTGTAFILDGKNCGE